MILHRPPGSEPHSPELPRRTSVLVAIVLLAMLGLTIRLWQLQVVRGESYFERARSNVVKTRSLPAVRGRMFDRHNRVLADSRPAFDILIDPSIATDQAIAEVIESLQLDSRETKSVRRRIASARARGLREPIVVLEAQKHERAAMARQIRYRYPGIEVDDRSARVYPNGEAAAHLLGYLNQPDGLELRGLAREGYRLGDVIGRFGLERRYESYLRGKRGTERYLVNATGERVVDVRTDGLIEGNPLTDPVPGHDLHLSIDLDVERAAIEALSGHAAGAVAVVEIETGRVLALVSKPAFDPNMMSAGVASSQLAELLADPRRPSVDKTMREHYPPASTFKLVTAIAALEAGMLTESERFSCSGVHNYGGRKFHCLGVHGAVDLSTAIKRSCNVYFWRVAERIQIDRLAKVARNLGFGSVSGLGINDEVAGRIPDRDYYAKRGGYQGGYALNASVGQGDVAVTVLQLANAYATIANGGVLRVPTVVDEIRSANGTLIKKTAPLVRSRMEISDATRAILADGSYRAVNESGGTAYRTARIGNVEISGKTGTAQVRARREEKVQFEGWHPHQNHAWFAGVAPSVNPTIAFAVLVEHGGSGGRQAGPIARAVVDALFPPTPPSPSSAPVPMKPHNTSKKPATAGGGRQ